MTSIRDIPEVAALDTRHSMIRIPPEIEVPLTPRVRRLIDTAEFRRLARISQLGLVSLVYPAALHTRFEHSLGVYRLALLYLKQLSYNERFTASVTLCDAKRLIAAALVHDLGHWPFCHPIEDIRLPGIPRHEQFTGSFLMRGEPAEVLRQEWNIEPAEIVRLLSEPPRDRGSKILASILSGPIDIDKMDYLFRDSLHAGVPYGRHFDQQRLIGSLCLNEAGDGLAMTDKGKTAAELMVFARYVMFSEVYWHHAVRSATAMLQRAFFLLNDELDRVELESLFRLSEPRMIARLLEMANSDGANGLLDGLFGAKRQLYKRVAQYSLFENGPLYQQLARRGYPWLIRCATHFANLATKALGQAVAAHEILFDAPPVEREVEFDVEVLFLKEQRYRPLEQVSPVVRALALEQFDDYVKRVRIFAHPRIAGELRLQSNLDELVAEAIGRTERQES